MSNKVFAWPQNSIKGVFEAQYILCIILELYWANTIAKNRKTTSSCFSSAVAYANMSRSQSNGHHTNIPSLTH